MIAPRHLLLLLLLPPLLAARCGSSHHLPPRPTQKLISDVELPPGTRRIELQFHEGLLTLEPSDSPACALEVDLLADDDEALELLRTRLGPGVEQVDDQTIRLCVALPTGASLDAIRTTWRLGLPRDVELVVSTRRGSVAVRGAEGPVTVHGGSGVVDVRMNGGRAVLATTSGSLMLRGDFASADLRSTLGRIDVQMPQVPVSLVDLAITTEEGQVYLDLHRGQQFYLFLQGQENQVRCDPEIRLSWEQVVPDGTTEALQGRLGDTEATSTGQIEIASRGTVFVRRRPETAADTGSASR